MGTRINTVEDIRKGLPARFGRGQGLAGPDYYGCCNTGKRPVILRNPYDQGGHFFMVGPEIDIDQLKYKIALDRVRGINKRVYRDKKQGYCVYVCKTRNNAVERFLDLCQKVMDWNEEQRQEHAKAREAARQGDMAGALALMDF